MLLQQIQQDHRHPLNSPSGHMVKLWTQLTPLRTTWKTIGHHLGQLWGNFATTFGSLKDYLWSVPLPCGKHEHIWPFYTTTKWHTCVIGKMQKSGSRWMEWRKINKKKNQLPMQSEHMMQTLMDKSRHNVSCDNFDLICHRDATWRHHQKDGCITMQMAPTW